MTRITASILGAVFATAAVSGVGAQGVGYSDSPRQGYYHDQGVYVPAFPGAEPRVIEEGRAFMPEVREQQTALAPEDDRDFGLIERFNDQNGDVRAFPE